MPSQSSALSQRLFLDRTTTTSIHTPSPIGLTKYGTFVFKVSDDMNDGSCSGSLDLSYS